MADDKPACLLSCICGATGVGARIVIGAEVGNTLVADSDGIGVEAAEGLEPDTGGVGVTAGWGFGVVTGTLLTFCEASGVLGTEAETTSARDRSPLDAAGFCDVRRQKETALLLAALQPWARQGLWHRMSQRTIASYLSSKGQSISSSSTV